MTVPAHASPNEPYDFEAVERGHTLTDFTEIVKPLDRPERDLTDCHKPALAAVYHDGCIELPDLGCGEHMRVVEKGLKRARQIRSMPECNDCGTAATASAWHVVAI